MTFFTKRPSTVKSSTTNNTSQPKTTSSTPKTSDLVSDPEYKKALDQSDKDLNVILKELDTIHSQANEMGRVLNGHNIKLDEAIEKAKENSTEIACARERTHRIF